MTCSAPWSASIPYAVTGLAGLSCAHGSISQRGCRDCTSSKTVKAAVAGGFHHPVAPDQLPNLLEMSAIFSLIAPPTELTTARTAVAMPTATSPYSTAVPPDSSLRNENTLCIFLAPCGCKQRHNRVAALN